jgi:hypothetical protein
MTAFPLAVETRSKVSQMGSGQRAPQISVVMFWFAKKFKVVRAGYIAHF